MANIDDYNAKLDVIKAIPVKDVQKMVIPVDVFLHPVKLRFEQHQNGMVHSTKDRRPLKLIYFEACLSQADALKREKYFKTHYGRMFLKNRLANWFAEKR